MKTTLSTSDIARGLQADDNANWSWAGARAMAEYLEEYEESTGEELEFDRVAIRCDFSEYESLVAWATDYFGGDEQAAEVLGLSLDMSGDEIEEADEERDETIREYIRDRGELIEFAGGIIVSSF